MNVIRLSPPSPSTPFLLKIFRMYSFDLQLNSKKKKEKEQTNKKTTQRHLSESGVSMKLVESCETQH